MFKRMRIAKITSNSVFEEHLLVTDGTIKQNLTVGLNQTISRFDSINSDCVFGR